MSADSHSLAAFFAAWELFANAAWCGTLAGGLLGLLGVYVVLRRLVFLSAALSQSAGLGVTLAFYGQTYWGLTSVLASPTWVAAAVTLAASWVAARNSHVLGVVYLLGTAGSLAIATRIVQEMQDIQTLLFGSAVAVLPESLQLIAVMTGLLLLLHIWWARGFILASFDPEGARVRRVPVRLLDAVLLGSLAVAISLCTRVLGALPVFAFSVLPAMAAVRCVATVQRALVVAALLGAISGFGGYVAAFMWELPVGAAQTLVACAWLPVSGAIAFLRTRRP